MKKNGTRLLGRGAVLALALGMASLAAAAQGRSRHFSDHDRKAVRGWEEGHRKHPPEGFRDRDRLSPDLEARLRVGVVLDPELRRRMHRAPHDLVVILAPPPPHYRYVVIDDHVCLVDREYRVSDVLHLELNF
ncbi:MAG: hypothetical protein ACRD1E_07830 [Terriglobales bacterium]